MASPDVLGQLVDAKLAVLKAKKVDDGGIYPPEPFPETKAGLPAGYLGSGSYGVVVRRRHPSGRLVAVKEIEKDRIRDKKKLQHILVEVCVLTTFKHPCCVQLHELVHTNSKIYLVMDLGSQDLFSYIRKKRRLPHSDAAVVLKQLLSVLKALHDFGVVHRDIKPENILIENNLFIQIIDFGVAKFIQKAKAAPPVYPGFGPPGQLSGNEMGESPGVLVTPFTGTGAYTSLEAIDGMLSVNSTNDSEKPWCTHRSDLQKLDIYAAGVVAYAMLTGTLPYKYDFSKQGQKMLVDIRKAMEEGLSFPPFVPLEAVDLIQKLMNNNPKHRVIAATALLHPFVKHVQMPDKSGDAITIPPSAKLTHIAPPPAPKKKGGGTLSNASSPPTTATPTPTGTGSSTASSDSFTPLPPGGASAASPTQQNPSDAKAEKFNEDTKPPPESPATPDSDPINPESRKDFKDGWGDIMDNIRRNEDDPDT